MNFELEEEKMEPVATLPLGSRSLSKRNDFYRVSTHFRFS